MHAKRVQKGRLLEAIQNCSQPQSQQSPSLFIKSTHQCHSSPQQEIPARLPCTPPELHPQSQQPTLLALLSQEHLNEMLERLEDIVAERTNDVNFKEHLQIPVFIYAARYIANGGVELLKNCWHLLLTCTLVATKFVSDEKTTVTCPELGAMESELLNVINFQLWYTKDDIEAWRTAHGMSL